MYVFRQYQPSIFRRILTSFNISSPDVSDMEADPLNIAAAKAPCFREFLSCSYFSIRLAIFIAGCDSADSSGLESPAQLHA